MALLGILQLLVIPISGPTFATVAFGLLGSVCLIVGAACKNRCSLIASIAVHALAFITNAVPLSYLFITGKSHGRYQQYLKNEDLVPVFTAMEVFVIWEIVVAAVAVRVIKTDLDSLIKFQLDYVISDT